MWPYVLKVLITAVVVVAVSELGKRSPLWGAVLASLPLTSLLAFIWLYAGTGSTKEVAALAQGIFWMVLATLPLFVLLPVLLRHRVAFWPALVASCLVVLGAYFALVRVLARFGVRL